jgi:hypothetical protein
MIVLLIGALGDMDFDGPATVEFVAFEIYVEPWLDGALSAVDGTL